MLEEKVPTVQNKTHILSFCSLLCCLLLAACGNTATIVKQPQNTQQPSPTSSSTPSPSSPSPSPSSTSTPATPRPQPSSTAIPTATPTIYGDLTGTWQADDGGWYFIHQTGDSVTWAGFSPDDGLTSTNVMCGTRNGNSFSGDWVNVPRGNASGNGSLKLDIDTSDPNNVQIRKMSGNTFGPSSWHRETIQLPVVPNPSARPTTADPNSLTGTWINAVDTQAHYYVRQIGGSVWWLGMDKNDGTTYTNVLCGSRSGDSFSGKWADVPRGTTLGDGDISLDYTYSSALGRDQFEMISFDAAGGPFPGWLWNRVVP